MNNPQNDNTKPRTQSINDAPTEPTEPRIEDGVENTPVPMMRPTLTFGVSTMGPRRRKNGCSHINIVQLVTPRWRPSPPEVSSEGIQLKITLSLGSERCIPSSKVSSPGFKSGSMAVVTSKTDSTSTFSLSFSSTGEALPVLWTSESSLSTGDGPVGGMVRRPLGLRYLRKDMVS